MPCGAILPREPSSSGTTQTSCSPWRNSSVQIVDDKIISIDEYWSEDDPAPQWRKDMHIGSKVER